jgi:hypothetical protein
MPSSFEVRFVPSQFTYDRPLVRDVACVIASVRIGAPIEHVQTIDRLTIELCRYLGELHEGFDTEGFLTTARYGE